jgi:hypothetical protein
MVKREDVVDIDLFAGNNDLFDQTLDHSLTIGEGETVKIVSQEVTKVFDMVDHGVPVEGLLLREGEVVQFPIYLLQFRCQFLATQLEFTQRDNLRLIGIEQALTLSFEAQAALL